MLISIQFEAHSRPRPSDLHCYTNIYLHIFHCNIQIQAPFFFKQMNSAWDKIKKIVPNMYGAHALLD